MDLDDIQATVRWSDDSLTDQEVQVASTWSKKDGFIEGEGTFGGGITYPSITAKGERLVSAGRSVRDDQANPKPESQPPFIVVQGSQGVNIVNNSSHVTQSNTVEIRIEKARQVADALESAAASPDVSTVRHFSGGPNLATSTAHQTRPTAYRTPPVTPEIVNAPTISVISRPVECDPCFLARSRLPRRYHRCHPDSPCVARHPPCAELRTTPRRCSCGQRGRADTTRVGPLRGIADPTAAI